MTQSPVEWGAATRMLRGESESGDRHLVRPFPDGVLLAAVDGIGHGHEAALAAGLAIETLEDHAAETLEAILDRCHERLRGTRGVVMSLASYSPRDRTLAWLGVGNVEGLLLRDGAGHGEKREWLLPHRGVVGGHLPALQASTLAMESGGLLVFATDGIDIGFAEGLAGREAPQALADLILKQHGKVTDDATVLVARLRG
jgi:hypothetical protein